jgi:hypothetical protein
VMQREQWYYVLFYCQAIEQEGKSRIEEYNDKHFPQIGEVEDGKTGLDQHFMDHYDQWLQSEVFGGRDQGRRLFKKFSHQVLKELYVDSGVKMIGPAPSENGGVGLWRDLIEDEFFKDFEGRE